MNEKKVKTVVFVCTGNTCRSPMAEAILRSELKRRQIENVCVYSAGLKVSSPSPINFNAAKTLTNKGLQLLNFTSKLVDEKVFLADAVVAMTEEILQKLKAIKAFGVQAGKLKKGKNNLYSFKGLTGADVIDPYGKGEEEYGRVFTQLEGGMSAIIEKFLVKKPRAKRKTTTQTTTKKRTKKENEI